MGAIGHEGEQAYRNTKNGHPMLVKKLTDTSLAERLKCSLGAVRSLVTGEVATLRARIESLQAELAKLEATAASHRADFERERDRADRLLTELLKANANATGATAAKLKGEIAAMRSAAEASTGANVVIARPSLDVAAPLRTVMNSRRF